MIKLKGRTNLRISDRIAVTAALVLTLTAAGSAFTPANWEDGVAPTSLIKANNTRQEEAQPELEQIKKPISFRTLLFRHG